MTTLAGPLSLRSNRAAALLGKQPEQAAYPTEVKNDAIAEDNTQKDTTAVVANT